MMTYERFKLLVEAYGANAARWPAGERAAALAFAETSGEARALLDEAAALDRLFDQADTAPVTHELQTRILAALPLANRSSWWLAALAPRAQWIPAAAFAISLALGIGVGSLIPAFAGLDESQADAALVALGEIDGEEFGEMGGGS